jgi:hypothetical protein
MLGDFNEVLWDFDHFSVRRRLTRQMLDFWEVLSYCDLHDLGFSGLPWTYNNMQRGERNVRVRLDQAVGSPGWKQAFPCTRVQHLLSSRSDHCPILIELEKEKGPKVPGIFRYEIIWEREDLLQEEIKSGWAQAGQVTHLGDTWCFE